MGKQDDDGEGFKCGDVPGKKGEIENDGCLRRTRMSESQMALASSCAFAPALHPF